MSTENKPLYPEPNSYPVCISSSPLLYSIAFVLILLLCFSFSFSIPLSLLSPTPRSLPLLQPTKDTKQDTKEGTKPQDNKVLNKYYITQHPSIITSYIIHLYILFNYFISFICYLFVCLFVCLLFVYLFMLLKGNGYAPLYAPQPGYGPPTSYPPGAYPQQYTTTTTVYRDGGSSAGMGIGWILYVLRGGGGGGQDREARRGERGGETEMYVLIYSQVHHWLVLPNLLAVWYVTSPLHPFPTHSHTHHLLLTSRHLFSPLE